MPGKDGQDGVPGLDGEKVGAWQDACWEEVEEESSASQGFGMTLFFLIPNRCPCREMLVAMVPQERKARMGCR